LQAGMHGRPGRDLRFLVPAARRPAVRARSAGGPPPAGPDHRTVNRRVDSHASSNNNGARCALITSLKSEVLRCSSVAGHVHIACPERPGHGRTLRSIHHIALLPLRLLSVPSLAIGSLTTSKLLRVLGSLLLPPGGGYSRNANHRDAFLLVQTKR
jgi:hypothetical protein